jgi:hypothetical protein
MCSADVGVLKGRVDHAPSNSSVRVQLVYSKDMRGESGETTVENGMFSIPIEFLTQSRGPGVNGIGRSWRSATLMRRRVHT